VTVFFSSRSRVEDDKRIEGFERPSSFPDAVDDTEAPKLSGPDSRDRVQQPSVIFKAPAVGGRGWGTMWTKSNVN
jgi:hypothetical protein